ncbi:MAG: hypothetical protein ACR2MD_01865 [Aridibacter sp.]
MKTEKEIREKLQEIQFDISDLHTKKKRCFFASEAKLEKEIEFKIAILTSFKECLQWILETHTAKRLKELGVK